MREIEFRAWLKNEKKMFEVDDIRNLLTDTLYEKEICFYDREFNGFQYADFEDIELMQYTGLKDKNGVKIFEGDIVEYSYRSVSGAAWGTAVVKFYDGAFQLEDIDDSDITELLYLVEDLEVIGNIYENPKLLEVQE